MHWRKRFLPNNDNGRKPQLGMSVNIQLMSDLHLEVHPHFVPTSAPEANLLVLAGDIGSYQAGSRIIDSDFGLARFSPNYGWPTPVIFVPGNHEYDTLDFDATHERLQEVCQRLGITWLEREVISLKALVGTRLRDGTTTPNMRFVGTTLWTDFDALAPTDAQAATLRNPLADQLKARTKAFSAANFYLKKSGTTRDGAPFLAEPLREQGLVCQAWLRDTLNEPFDGITIAITHFAPSLRSSDPRYGLTPGTAGFCNALDDLLPLANLWLHGHLHSPSDYVASGCRVVANPLGYVRKNEQAGFRPMCLVTVS
jgi:Calcineurin-like phosphoesterase